jgi:enhancing lycopene biosynthesis protein 2
MKPIAVMLAGCGVADGSEIHESVLTLLALDKAGAAYQCMAPNIPQRRVMNHLTQQEDSTQSRNVLVEAARIARGNILDVSKAKAEDYAALIFPGGFGAALNLCDFALQGANCTVQPNVLAFADAFVKAGKPMGFICIAPSMIAKIYGPGVELTIGNDQQTAQKLEAMGAKHVNCAVDACVVDEPHKVVSTPAYMLAKSIKEAATGIDKLVNEVLALAAVNAK